MAVILNFVDKLAKVHGRWWRERKEAKYSSQKVYCIEASPLITIGGQVIVEIWTIVMV